MQELLLLLVVVGHVRTTRQDTEFGWLYGSDNQVQTIHEGPTTHMWIRFGVTRTVVY